MSLTYSAAVAGIIAQALHWAGIDVEVESLKTTLGTLVTIGTGVVAIYGRVRKGDVSWLGMRKP